MQGHKNVHYNDELNEVNKMYLDYLRLNAYSGILFQLMVFILQPGFGVSMAFGGGGPCWTGGDIIPPGGGGGAGLPGGGGGAIPGLGGGGGGIGLPGGGGGGGTPPGGGGGAAGMPDNNMGPADALLLATPGGGGGAGTDFCVLRTGNPPGGGGAGGGSDPTLIVGIGGAGGGGSETEVRGLGVLLIRLLLIMPEPGLDPSSVCVSSSLCFFVWSLHFDISLSPSS